MRTNEFHRSNSNAILTGVCYSLSKQFYVDVSIIRFIFVISFMYSYLTLIFYIIATIVIPEKPEDISEVSDNTTNKTFKISLLFCIFFIIFFLWLVNFPFFTNNFPIPLWLSLLSQLFLISVLISIITYKSDNKRLFRDINNKLICGTFSGIAQALSINVIYVRLTFSFFLIIFNITSIILIILYLIFSLILKTKNEINQ